MITEVLRIGSKVKFDKGLNGTIVEVNLSSHEIRYKISWWNGRDYKSEWFYTYEFEPETYNDTVKIGFK